MRIVVTGGAGFIASQIADAYLSLGHTRVPGPPLAVALAVARNNRAVSVVGSSIRATTPVSTPKVAFSSGLKSP